MKNVSECAVCAWRKDCKMKYTYETSGLYCKEFTKDVTLFAPKEKPAADGGKGNEEKK
ncbi:MAG: hypothetical protein HZA04_07480 [Nitrospinae bacterium]|nr:hypothetical protein [Nitrospinota bacterium]